MKPSYKEVLETTISGIPCKIGILTYIKVPPWKGSAMSAPSDLDYYGYTDLEYDILDRKGYPAPWLEKKLSESGRDILEEFILTTMEEMKNEELHGMF